MENNQAQRSGFTAQSAAASRYLDEQLQGLVQTKQVHQAVVAVASIDGAFNWIGAAGASDPTGTPMQADTPFWIASVTKLYIATVILKLQERGLLSIDDPMAAHLPGQIIKGLHLIDGIDHTDQITLRHLLGHSSGLPDYLEIHCKGEKSLFERILEEGDRAWSIEDFTRIVRDVNKPLFPPQPVGRSKKRARYSDTNYQLLITIIEEVTGEPLHAAFEKMLYRPLGLHQTFHPGTMPLKPAPPVAAVWNGDRILDLPRVMASFKDLNSTAADLLAFMRALIRGEVFDDAATLGLMTGEWNRFGFSMSPVGPGWPIEYGLGIMRFRFPRIFTPLRPIPEVIGHTGVSGSWLFYCPPLDLLLAGTVSQLTAAPVPFRFVPKLLSGLKAYAG